MVVRGLVRRVFRGVVRRVIRGLESVGSPRSGGQFFQLSLCKPEKKSRVCITVENSPNPSSVYIRLCKHRKKVFYCFYK